MSWIHLVWILLLVACPIIYHEDGNQQSVLIFGNIAKIFSLFVAGLALTFTTNAYNPGESAKRAWTFLAAGAWMWLFAQLIFAHYKIVLGVNVYPNIADLFFVLGYLPLFGGLIVLILDFRSTGLPMGGRTSYIVQALIFIVIYVGMFFAWLKPLLFNQDDVVTKFLNFGYPTVDFLLFFVTSVLIRISWVLRGGSLAKAYIALGMSFFLTGVADLIFAYRPIPAIDIFFFSAYFILGLAGFYQLRMLRQ
ncbi:hypothetical protein L0152_01450 [bacterium]|nr:hypothetical protein [bacterium]